MRWGLLAVVLAGCSTEIRAKDYNQKCSVNAECAAIFVGDVCACGCESGGINRTDLTKAEADRAALRCSSTNLCKPCAAVEGFCQAGTCGTRPEGTDGGA